MILKDLIDDFADNKMALNLYFDELDVNKSIDLEEASLQDIAFQKVLRIVPLQGYEESPASELGIVISSETSEIPRTPLSPTAISLRDYFNIIPSDVKRIVAQPFNEESMVLRFTIEDGYPRVPYFKFEVADEIISMMVPQ